MHRKSQDEHLLNKTYMRLVFIYIILSIITSTTLGAQTVSDSEFKWIKNDDCLPMGISKEIFLKVEKDPMLTQIRKSEFDKLIEKAVAESSLEKHNNGIVKLKILFEKGQNLCVTKFGTKSIDLNKFHKDRIIKTIHEISEFDCGKQRNVEVNCLGILYIDISDGVVREIRNVNFMIS